MSRNQWTREFLLHRLQQELGVAVRSEVRDVMTGRLYETHFHRNLQAGGIWYDPADSRDPWLPGGKLSSRIALNSPCKWPEM